MVDEGTSRVALATPDSFQRTIRHLRLNRYPFHPPRFVSLLKEVPPKFRARVASVIRQAGKSHSPLFEDTSRARLAISAHTERMEKEWFTALRAFDSDRERGVDVGTARVRLEDSWRSSIRRGHEAAFRAGYASRGHANAASLTAGRIRELAPELDGMIARQADFSAQFAQQYASGALNAPGRLGVGPRSRMYASALTAGFNVGAVTGGRSDELIAWVLGPCDHCVDCPALQVSGPYTRDRLPTYPGGGQTVCRTNCCCHLRFIRGARSAVPDAEDGQVDRFILPGVVVPVGFETPSASDVAILRDLETRRTFSTRQIAALDAGEERSSWIRKRAALQAQMDAYRTERALDYTPEFLAGSVVTSADISADDIDDILRRGLDGPTVAKADKSLISRIGSRVRRLVRAALDKLGIPLASPVVPTAAAIIRVRDDADNVTLGFTKFMDGEQSTRESKQKTESVLDEDGPVVEQEWTINLVTIGIRDAADLQLACLDLLAGSGAPYFLRVGPFDDPWFSIVSASGVWIRGGASEVKRMVDGLREGSAPNFAVAPLLV